jgi:hypothetical protein
VGDVVDAHHAVFAVAVHRCFWRIDRDLLVVDTQAGTVGIGVDAATVSTPEPLSEVLSRRWWNSRESVPSWCGRACVERASAKPHVTG